MFSSIILDGGQGMGWGEDKVLSLCLPIQYRERSGSLVECLASGSSLTSVTALCP